MSTHTIKSLFTGICLVLFSASMAMAAQTCTTETEIPNLHPDSRYTNHGDGTVTDKETGLMWKQCLEGVSGNACATGTAETYTWQQALALPVALNGGNGFAGHSDWRLPNVTELESLVTQNCASPSINPSLFPSDPGAFVWSSSPYAGNLNSAWYVGFDNGYTNVGYRYVNVRVRLVRSGQ